MATQGTRCDENLDWFLFVCATRRMAVYIAARETLNAYVRGPATSHEFESITAAHNPVATRIGKNCTRTQNSFFPSSKNIAIGSAHSRNPRRVVTRRTAAAAEEEECA